MTYERLIGLIIRLYPAGHRDEYGDEVVSTLRDCVASLGRRDSAWELADLAAHALRERVRMTATRTPGAVAVAAAPLAAGSAVALSLVFLVFAEWPWRPVTHAGAHPFGPFATLGAAVYLAWLLVFLAAVSGRGGTARILAGLATAVAVALVPLAHLTVVERPPLFVLGVLAMFGVIVLAAPADPLRRSPLDRRGLTICVVAATGILSGITLEYGLPELSAPGASRPLWYRGTEAITQMGHLMPYVLAALLAVALLCLRLNRRLPLGVVVVAVPWAVFVYGTPGRPSSFLVAVLGAAAIAGVFPALRAYEAAIRTPPEAGA